MSLLPRPSLRPTRPHPGLRRTGLGWACVLALAGAPTPALHAQSAAPAPSAAQRLPSMGDAVSDDFDLNAERKLGDGIMRDIRRDPDFLDDPLLTEYLDTLFLPLLAAARHRGEIDNDIDHAFAWQTFAVRDKVVNAFALPGGYIGVYLGLVAMTATPDELASVLAHELTHVTQRHIARSMANSSRQGMATMAAMIVGVLAASRSKSIDGVQAVVMGSQAAMAQGQLNFSRDMEREADRIGLDLMGEAGYASAGMAGMFEKLDAASRLNDNGQYPYLRSHPLTSERISEAKLRASEQVASRGPSRVDHALMQARARVLMDATEPALRRQQAAGQAAGAPLTDVARLAALYTGALASVQLRDFDRAEAAWAEGAALAAKAFGGEPLAARAFALGRLGNLAERAAAAASSAEAARLGGQMDAVLAPWAADRSRPLQLARAQAALARSRAADTAAQTALRASTEELQTWVAEHRRDAAAWQALSQCAGLLGLQLRSLRAGAEAAYARGDITGAVDRFRAAQKAAKSAGADQYLEASIIESRLRDTEAERRRMQAEARGERVE